MIYFKAGKVPYASLGMVCMYISIKSPLTPSQLPKAMVCSCNLHFHIKSSL